MKTMTCNQLGGACETKFQAETFEEMAELSKKHAVEMFAKEDAAHLEAKEQMKNLMQSPEAMQAWFAERRREFNELPED
jgi:hypothetical protein